MLPLSDEVLAVRVHFEFLRKRNRGLVTILCMSDSIVAGIGKVGFMEVKFLYDRIKISAAMPILPSNPSDSSAYCIKLHKHRKKTSIAREELVQGLAETNGKLGPRHLHDHHVSQIGFEYARPYSLHAAEYFANKIISVVRRKVYRVGHNVLLKDPADKTDLIALVTAEWEANQPRFLRKL